MEESYTEYEVSSLPEADILNYVNLHNSKRSSEITPFQPTSESTSYEYLEKIREKKQRYILCLQRCCCSITFLFLSIFLIQSALSVLATFGFLYFSGQTYLEDTSMRQFLQASKVVHSKINRVLSTIPSHIGTLESLVQSEILNQTGPSQWRLFLGAFSQLNPYGSIAVFAAPSRAMAAFDRDNNILYFCNSNSSILYRVNISLPNFDFVGSPSLYAPQFNVLNTVYYRYALLSRDINTTPIQFDLLSPDSSIFYASKQLRNVTTDELIGVLGFRYKISVIQKNLQDATSSIVNSYAFILDENNNLVTTSRGQLYEPNRLLPVQYYKNINDTTFRQFFSVIEAVGTNVTNSTLMVSTLSHFIDVTQLSKQNGYYFPEWKIFVIATKPNFADAIFSTVGAPLALVFALAVFLLASTILLIIVHIITNQIRSTALQLFRLSQLEIPKEKKWLRFCLFAYELVLLHQSLKTIKSGLTSFVKYIPQDVVKNLVRKKISNKLEVFQMNMSILFCDIANFTDTTETLDSNLLLKYMSPYFSEMSKVIEANKGLIDKFIGDAILAVWNAKIAPVSKHELYACKTALEMQTRADELSKELEAKGLPPLQLRIGVNTGDVLVGNVGSENRYNYTVIGDDVNVASRLESLNKYFSTKILIGESTYIKVVHAYCCFWIDHVQLKGKSKAIHVYALIGNIQQTHPFQLNQACLLLKAKDYYERTKFSKMHDLCVKVIRVLKEERRKPELFDSPIPIFCEQVLPIWKHLKQRAYTLKEQDAQFVVNGSPSDNTPKTSLVMMQK